MIFLRRRSIYLSTFSFLWYAFCIHVVRVYIYVYDLPRTRDMNRQRDDERMKKIKWSHIKSVQEKYILIKLKNTIQYDKLYYTWKLNGPAGYVFQTNSLQYYIKMQSRIITGYQRRLLPMGSRVKKLVVSFFLKF